MVRDIASDVRTQWFSPPFKFRAILHDEEMYPQPFAFKPERFLNSEEGKVLPPDPATIAAFGFGRRYGYSL